MTNTIRFRQKVTVNTDPQRRCYNGAHFSSEVRWSAWATLETNLPDDRVEGRLAFWRELNEYAVSQRGSGSLIQYAATPNKVEITL